VLRQLSGTSQNLGLIGHRPSDSDDRHFTNTLDKLSTADEQGVAADLYNHTGDALSSDITSCDLTVNSNRVMFRSIFQAERLSLSQGKRASITSSSDLSRLENTSDEEIIESYGSIEHFDMSQPIGEFSRQILSAREELKRLDRVSQSVVSETVKPVQTDHDKFWEQVELSVKAKQYPLKIGDLDFSDVSEMDDEFCGGLPSPAGSIAVQNQVVASLLSAQPPPPPPPPPLPPPPPPPFPLMTDLQYCDGIPMPPALPVAASLNSSRSKKTVRLHWKEAKAEFVTAGGRRGDTIWDQMLREIGSVKIDPNKLEHLFETRTVDIKTRV
jgi:hypothetical protein